MKSNLRIIIIDRSIHNINAIKNAISDEDTIEVVDSCNNWFIGIKKAKDLKVNMIIINEEIRGIRKNNVASICKLNLPQVKVIIIAEDKNSKKLKECLSEGADNYILNTYKNEEIKKVLMKYCYERKDEKTPIKDKEPHNQCTLISVFNTKGGVGRSTLVANLSIALKEKTKAPVAVIDLNIGNSDIPIIMNIFPRKTLGEFRTDSHRDLEKYLIQHESGVEVFTFLKENEESTILFKEEVEEIIEDIKTKFAYILIDMPSYYDEVNQYGLEISDQILLVSTWDLSSIRNTIETIKVLNKHNVSKEKVNIILNRYENDYGLNIENIKKMTGKEELLFIPEDRRTATDSINSGKPFILNRKKTQISKSVVNIANRIITKNSVASF